MKLILKSFFIITTVLFFSTSVFAQSGAHPPPPAPAPGPPGFPIDNSIYILLFFAVVLGLYKVHKFKEYKKTPN